MLVLASRLRSQPIMSLQTGGEIAHITDTVIDPADLAILAYEVVGPLVSG